MSINKYWPSIEEINNCIKDQAENSSDAVLLAVHQKFPLTFSRVGPDGNVMADSKQSASEEDFLKYFLPLNWNRKIAVLPLFASAIISAYLSYYAWVFVQYEKEGGSILYGNLPIWIFQIILPISFAVIAIRFFVKALKALFMNFSLSTQPKNK